MEKDLATNSVQCPEVIDNAPVLVDDSDDVDIPVGQKRGRAPISEAVDDAAASPSSTNSIVDDVCEASPNKKPGRVLDDCWSYFTDNAQPNLLYCRCTSLQHEKLSYQLAVSQ
jgi:hypothetical protein